jgi:cobalt-zinc-cadmium efflux system outer membrane protein
MLQMTRANQFIWFSRVSLIGLLLAAGCALPGNVASTKVESPGRAEMRKEHGDFLLQAAADAPMGRAQSEADDRPAPQTDTTSIGNDHPLSIADLEALALENNPTLAQAAAAIGMASGQLQQVGLYPNPQLGYLRSDSSPSGRFRSDGVFVGQEIVTAGKLWKSQAVETQEVERLRWERESQERRVLNDVRIRFFEVLGAQRAAEISERLLRLAQEQVELSEKLFEAKHASKADLLQARIQLKTLRIGLREAEARRRAAWKQLANVVGCPALAAGTVAGELDGEIPPLDWDTSWQQLLAASPQVQAARVRIEHSRNEYQREKAQPWPNVNVQIVADRDQVQQATQVSTLLSVPVPVFNRNQGNIAHAVADIHEAAAEVRRTELALRDLLAEAFRRYETARAQVEELRDQILPDAEENLELTASGYKAGEIAFPQVLTARQTYFQSSLAYVEALVEMRKTRVEIDGLMLTGGLNPATIGAALQSQPGMINRQQRLLNQVQEGASKQILPPALQTSSGGP